MNKMIGIPEYFVERFFSEKKNFYTSFMFAIFGAIYSTSSFLDTPIQWIGQIIAGGLFIMSIIAIIGFPFEKKYFKKREEVYRINPDELYEYGNVSYMTIWALLAATILYHVDIIFYVAAGGFEKPIFTGISFFILIVIFIFNFFDLLFADLP